MNFSTRGRQILTLLHAHASKLSDRVSSAAGTAADECEREDEKEAEVEQKMNEEVYREREVPRCESNWVSWEQALLCNSLHEFVSVAAHTPVRCLIILIVLELLSLDTNSSLLRPKG